MLVRSCWHKKSWSYFDNFNEVFNACFVCLFCLVNYKKKKKKKSYEFTLYHKPHLKFRKSFSIGGDPPLSPTQHQHQHKNPGGPDQRHIIKINRASSASVEKFEEVCLFYVIPECFPGQNQIEILLNYALISINKTLSQTPYADYIQILQFSSETEFTPLILAPTGMATR